MNLNKNIIESYLRKKGLIKDYLQFAEEFEKNNVYDKEKVLDLIKNTFEHPSYYIGNDILFILKLMDFSKLHVVETFYYLDYNFDYDYRIVKNAIEIYTYLCAKKYNLKCYASCRKDLEGYMLTPKNINDFELDSAYENIEEEYNLKFRNMFDEI